jgi:hypothetical protein
MTLTHEKICQPAYKPGSVRRANTRDGHSSRAAVAGRLKQPTRARVQRRTCGLLRGRTRPYSVLLPVGLAMPCLLPGARCALTAPFHPCQPENRRAVSFLWRYPWGRPRRTLSGTVSLWSPDFPPQSGGHPADWPRRDRRLGEWRQHVTQNRQNLRDCAAGCRSAGAARGWVMTLMGMRSVSLITELGA